MCVYEDSPGEKFVEVDSFYGMFISFWRSETNLNENHRGEGINGNSDFLVIFSKTGNKAFDDLIEKISPDLKSSLLKLKKSIYEYLHDDFSSIFLFEPPPPHQPPVNLSNRSLMENSLFSGNLDFFYYYFIFIFFLLSPFPCPLPSLKLFCRVTVRRNVYRIRKGLQ